MKTDAEIITIANAYIEKLSDEEYAFCLYLARKFKLGFLIGYQSKEFVLEHSKRDLCIGLTPFIVDYEGNIHHEGFAYLGGEEIIEKFIRAHG